MLNPIKNRRLWTKRRRWRFRNCSRSFRMSWTHWRATKITSVLFWLTKTTSMRTKTLTAWCRYTDGSPMCSAHWQYWRIRQDSCQPVRGFTQRHCDKWPWIRCAVHQAMTSQMMTLPTDNTTPSRARNGSNGGSTPSAGTIFHNLKYFCFGSSAVREDSEQPPPLPTAGLWGIDTRRSDNSNHGRHGRHRKREIRETCGIWRNNVKKTIKYA